ncbi:hypothetical protein COO60DRAFT_1266051 [Scenedesmus sp. NREL 46B-D3]|nr:hypothetical protein COO60DRAFT_1266051 [Scenedesmus sp. NREL 46B-D3]
MLQQLKHGLLAYFNLCTSTALGFQVEAGLHTSSSAKPGKPCTTAGAGPQGCTTAGAGPQGCTTAGAGPQGCTTAGAGPQGCTTAGAGPQGCTTAGAGPQGCTTAHPEHRQGSISSHLSHARQVLVEVASSAATGSAKQVCNCVATQYATPKHGSCCMFLTYTKHGSCRCAFAICTTV